MSIKTDILTTLQGGRPERVPWNIHHQLLPQGQLERAMRDRGLGIVEKSVPPYRAVSREVSVEERQTFEDDRLTLHVTHHTPVGDLHSRKVIGPDGSPWVMEYPVKEVADFPILEYIGEDTLFLPNDPQIRARQQSLGEDGLVLCRLMRSPLQRLLIEWMGTEAVSYALFDHPGEMERLLDRMADADAPAHAIAAESAAEALWSAENITAWITSPELFERHCLPYYGRVAELLRGRAKPYGVHMDGQLHALQDLIAASPLDFVEGFTPPPIGDLELEDARRAWPEKVLWTNFPGSVLHRRDDEVVQYAAELVKTGMEGGRFLLTLTEDFPDPERTLPLIAEGVARYEAEITA
jgi:hypothetical protein